jgi:hypothetical protein
MAKDGAVGTIIGIGVFAAAAFALYEWLQSQCSTSGSTLYGGSICGTLSNIGLAPVSVVAPLTTAASVVSAPSVPTQTTAVLSNLTSPGQPYAVGDSFQLLVTGPPNQPVIGSASQNGNVTSSTNFGNTDANGQLIVTGSWGPGNAGSWVESWQVGSAAPASLTFTIAPSGVAGLGSGSNRIARGLINRGSYGYL